MSDEQQQENKQVVQFDKPRLAYHRAFYDKFGIDISSWKVLCETIFPHATKSESVIMAWNYCKARRLDPFKRPVHIVPIWDRDKGRLVETVWPGIAELRTTAMRTGLYAGKDPAQFGPMVTTKFEGAPKSGGTVQIVSVTHPEWCQITVYRMVDGERMPFPGPTVYWLETYSRKGKSDLPNAMWEQRPIGQLEKCAEAAALRSAFPEEIGEDYAAEEMHGRALGELRDVTPRPRPEDYQDTPGREQADAANTSGEPPESEQEPQAEDPPQEEAAADDFPGDKPLPEQKPAAKKAAKKAAATKSEKPAGLSTEPEDPNARWKIATDAMSYLATFKSVLRHTKSEDDVNAMLGVNSEAIAKLHQDTQDAIFKAADERKEALSGG